MKRPWLAAVLNFFFLGLGMLYNGRRRGIGAALTLGAIVLTYVELQLQGVAPDLWTLMFGAVFVINTAMAVDGYQEARAISGEAQPASA